MAFFACSVCVYAQCSKYAQSSSSIPRASAAKRSNSAACLTARVRTLMSLERLSVSSSADDSTPCGEIPELVWGGGSENVILEDGQDCGNASFFDQDYDELGGLGPARVPAHGVLIIEPLIEGLPSL